MYAWTPRGFGAFDREADFQRQAAHASFRILRIKQDDVLWSQIVKDVAEWLDASAVRAFGVVDDAPALRAAAGRDPIPSDAFRMERALAQRSLAYERSLISNHPRLDPDLTPLAVALAATGSVVQILHLRANSETHGLVAVHWLSAPRPGFERRSGFYSYWDNAGLAVALFNERAALERTAFVDPLTSLPNGRALKAELERHAHTWPLGVLVLDFDGMRAANAAFENDYARGGDVLIVAVADALRAFARPRRAPGPHAHPRRRVLPDPARQRRGGDGRPLRPAAAAAGPTSRCRTPTATSTAAPPSAGASRAPGEPIAETLARASRAMHERKRATRSR